ncbi:MAG: hypothetical protein ACE5IA_08130 [Dehalococcoidia bacterium]
MAPAVLLRSLCEYWLRPIWRSTVFGLSQLWPTDYPHRLIAKLLKEKRPQASYLEVLNGLRQVKATPLELNDKPFLGL